MGVSDLKTESKRGRGRERAGTVSTTQLPAESAEIQSPAQKLRVQTKRSSFDGETSSDSAKAWTLATKHRLQMATRGI